MQVNEYKLAYMLYCRFMLFLTAFVKDAKNAAEARDEKEGVGPQRDRDKRCRSKSSPKKMQLALAAQADAKWLC